MILFFDTETTGVPKNYKAPISDLDNWPRVIQLAWAAYTDLGEFLGASCQLIKPDGWVMPTEKFWIDNGFSQEESMEKGMPIEEALRQFVEMINESGTMVAHNMQFDFPIICAEMMRANVRATNKPEKFCTMQSSTKFCNLPGPYGLKWPKLEELHHILFKEGFDGAHDALNDVKATARCYFHMKENNLFDVKKEKFVPNPNLPSASDL